MPEKKVLTTIGDQVSIYLYDNGFMVEANGKDAEGDWKNVKVVCKSTNEIFELVKQFISLERDE